MFKELFVESLTEEFDQEPLVPLAMEWLEKKFQGKKYKFIHRPRLDNTTKTYSVSIKDNHFEIAGRIMDTNSNGIEDTVLFKIRDVDLPEEPKEEEEAF